VDAGAHAGADVVVASRHVPGGSDDGLSSGARVLVSSLSTWLSKAMFPLRLRGVSDPMSGFFAIRPGAIDVDVMKPPGFKVLLELLVRSPRLRKAEVPFVFGDRQFGESKASLREGVRFVRQLAQLSLSRIAGRLAPTPATLRAAGFAAVGLTGLVVNLLFTWLLADPITLGINYLVAAILATQVSSTWNFLLTDSLVYRGPRRYTRSFRWLGFMAMSNVVLVLRIPLLALLVGVLGLHYLLATGITLVLGFLLRFKSQERLTLTEEMA
jgi:dolichol-phosphate mannosyltransferase